MSEPREEPSASMLVVLGLIARHGPMTPYELKAGVERSVAPFWPIPHAQLYRDPPKLAALGLLREETEESGRRRRTFHLTPEGRAALARWLADPHCPDAETRDPAQLKLAFTDLGDPAARTALARAEAAKHRGVLARYEELQAGLEPADADTSSRAVMLRYGILHEEAHARFWESLIPG